MLFTALLLQTQSAPPPPPYLAFAAFAVSVVGFLFGAWAFFRKESAETRTAKAAAAVAAAEWKKNVDATLLHHEQRFTGITLEHERFRDETASKFAQQESRLGEVQRLREDFAGMKAKVDMMVVGMDQINHKIDRLLERKTL